MSIPCKFERSILSHEEHEVILRSHHPGIYDSGLDELKRLRQRLRDMRSKERTLTRAKQREARSKGPPRGESFPGTVEHPLRRKQVFSAALKRVNREIDRLEKLEMRTAHNAELVQQRSREEIFLQSSHACAPMWTGLLLCNESPPIQPSHSELQTVTRRGAN